MYAKLETRTFLAMLLGVSLAFILLMKPFFGPIFWAVAIALIFHPVQQLLVRRLGDRPTLNALITLFVCMVIVVIPVLVLGAALIAEGIDYTGIDVRESSLEDIFVSLLGEEEGQAA